MAYITFTQIEKVYETKKKHWKISNNRHLIKEEEKKLIAVFGKKKKG